MRNVNKTFNEFIRVNESGINKLVRKIGRNYRYEDREDLHSLALEFVWKAIKKYNGTGSLEGYCYSRVYYGLQKFIARKLQKLYVQNFEISGEVKMIKLVELFEDSIPEVTFEHIPTVDIVNTCEHSPILLELIQDINGLTESLFYFLEEKDSDILLNRYSSAEVKAEYARVKNQLRFKFNQYRIKRKTEILATGELIRLYCTRRKNINPAIFVNGYCVFVEMECDCERKIYCKNTPRLDSFWYLVRPTKQ